MKTQSVHAIFSNRWSYVATSTAFLALVTIGAVGVVSQDEQPHSLAKRRELLKKPEQTLSVDETLGVVVNPWLGGPLRKHYSRANPEAKDAIYRVLNDEKLKQYHPHAWAILGYIGGESDAQRLDAAIGDFKSIPRMLTPAEHDQLTVLFNSLGVMCGRNIDSACDVAEKMMKPQYWRDSKFRWNGNPEAKQLNHELESVMYLMVGYSLSLDPELEKHAQAILTEVNDRQQREVLKGAIDAKLLLGHGWNTRSVEEEPVTREERRKLASFFNGDLQNPGPARFEVARLSK